MKGGDEKIVSNVYPFDWVNPKGEQRNGKIMIKNGIFMAIMFIETRETTETTLLHFEDPLKRSNFCYIKETDLD